MRICLTTMIMMILVYGKCTIKCTVPINANNNKKTEIKRNFPFEQIRENYYIKHEICLESFFFWKENVPFYSFTDIAGDAPVDAPR